jgi:hypothetical protein
MKQERRAVKKFIGCRNVNQVFAFVEIVVDKLYSHLPGVSTPHFSRLKCMREIHKRISVCTNHGR